MRAKSPLAIVLGVGAWTALVIGIIGGYDPYFFLAIAAGIGSLALVLAIASRGDGLETSAAAGLVAGSVAGGIALLYGAFVVALLTLLLYSITALFALILLLIVLLFTHVMPGPWCDASVSAGSPGPCPCTCGPCCPSGCCGSSSTSSGGCGSGNGCGSGGSGSSGGSCCSSPSTPSTPSTPSAPSNPTGGGCCGSSSSTPSAPPTAPTPSSPTTPAGAPTPVPPGGGSGGGGCCGGSSGGGSSGGGSQSGGGGSAGGGCGGSTGGGGDSGGGGGSGGCGGSGGSCGGSGSSGWRNGLAHHPDAPAFDNDIFRIRGVRLCIGCFTTYPVLIAATFAAWSFAPDWHAALLAGALLAGLQGISSAGWARWKMAKIMVKASLGTGLGLLTWGLHAAAAPLWMRVCGLVTIVALARLSAVPRSRRLARMAVSKAEACPGIRSGGIDGQRSKA
ncbi:MAG: hypothetical protein ACYDDF_10630 [Thermoplasmatota archaeon]